MWTYHKYREMSNKYMKRCSQPLVLMKQSHTLIQFHFKGYKEKNHVDKYVELWKTDAFIWSLWCLGFKVCI